MARAHTVHLSNTIKQLGATRKTATENTKRAQTKYKAHHDKTAVTPTVLPGNKVWLFCHKVLKGQSSKLMKKWTGAYTILDTGPYHTFKLRSDKDKNGMKTLVNAARLKAYHSPINQPDHLVDDNMESDDTESDDNDNTNSTTTREGQYQRCW